MRLRMLFSSAIIVAAGKRMAWMRVLVLENPISGVRGTDMGEEMVGFLRRRGMDAFLQRTSGRGDATHIASTTTAGAIVVVGGDGTLNEVVNGVFGRDVVVVPVPAGLSNVAARSLGLHKPGDSIEALLERRFTQMDVFCIRTENRERRFVAMAGFGFDGSVVEATHGARKGGVGFAGYLPGIARALLRRHRPMAVYADGLFLGRARFVVLASTPYYGGPLWLLPHARFDDGMLDVLLSDAEGVRAVVLHAGAVVGRHLRHRGVRVARCRHLFIRPAERGHVDGEPLPPAESLEVRFAGQMRVARGRRVWRKRG